MIEISLAKIQKEGTALRVAIGEVGYTVETPYVIEEFASAMLYIELDGKNVVDFEFMYTQILQEIFRRTRNDD